MNSMLTISTAHKNNYFKITYGGYEYDLFITDDSYTAVSLRDYIKGIFEDQELPIALDYNKSTNNFYLY